ncbi:hypothetical protein BC828DRAFT_200449 [Blastocladiella britannica]|nr:hypothetical protein BC828DRAFT_200449 [Blastocladiella britannica]
MLAMDPLATAASSASTSLFATANSRFAPSTRPEVTMTGSSHDYYDNGVGYDDHKADEQDDDVASARSSSSSSPPSSLESLDRPLPRIRLDGISRPFGVDEFTAWLLAALDPHPDWLEHVTLLKDPGVLTAHVVLPVFYFLAIFLCLRDAI